MIKTVFSIPMEGKRHHASRNIKGLKEATAAICLIEHSDGSFVHGVGILYPDKEHLYFNESKTMDPYQLWRDTYAASKMYHFTDEALGAVVMIADKAVSLDDPRFTDIDISEHIPYGYNVEHLRNEIFEQKIPEDAIKKIVKEFQDHRLPISDPFAQETSAKRKCDIGSFLDTSHMHLGAFALTM